LLQVIEFVSLSGTKIRFDSQITLFSPVLFPVNREFGCGDRSTTTASAANQSSLSQQLREGGGNARDSAPFAAEVMVSASQNCPRIRHFRRLSQRAIFGVSFLRERSLVLSESKRGELVGPVQW
jgi:hypothetical protein